jgi:hypothetical protein
MAPCGDASRAAAPTLAGQRHPVATAGLRARGDRETPCGHGPDLCSLAAPERKAPTRATRYTYLDHRIPPVVRAPGCWSTAGAPSLSAPLPAERAMGAKKRRHKGSARALSVEKILRSKTRRAVRRSLAELSERPLRGGLPVLRCLPLCALPYRSIARVGNPITVTLSASIVRASWRAGRARDGFCRFPTLSIQGVRTGALGRSAVRPGGLCPASESFAWSHAAGIVEAGSCKVAEGSP